MQTMKKFFSAPIFPDPEITRRAGMLSFLINLHIVVALSTTLFLTFLTDVNHVYPLAAFLSCLPALALRVLVHRGHIFLVSILFISMVYAIMPTLAWFSGYSVATVPVTVFQTITIVMAGLVLGGWGAAIFVALTGAVNGALIYAELTIGYATVPGYDPIAAWIMQLISFSGIAGMLYVTNRLIGESFERAGKENNERRIAENEVRKLNEELQQEIAELERFTYTVSHDLRSPLVTIKGFLGMLEKDMLQSQKERVQNDIQRISNATEKMQALLNDLLELSRIGRIVNPSEDVDLSRLTREALVALEGQFSAHNIQVNILGLPLVYADRVRMREVMQNLLENAAKYMGDQTSPVIEIGAREQEGQPVIYVKDNGIGIDPTYHTRIFGLFEKLDPSIEGTGIGLAIVKRIAELHGGRVWVESEGLGKGSTFCFTVPDSRESNPPDLVPVRK